MSNTLGVGFDPGAFAAGAGLASGIAGFANNGDNGNDPQTGQPLTVLGRFMNANRASREGSVEGLQNDAAKAKALRGVLTAYADDMDDEDAGAALKAKAHVMGLGDLEGAVGGIQNKQSSDLNAARIKALQDQSDARADAQADQAAGVRALAQFAQTMNGKLNPALDLDGAPMRTAADASALKGFTPTDRANFGVLAQVAKSNPAGLPMVLKAMTQMGAGGAGADTAPDSFFKPTDPAVTDLASAGAPGWKRIVTGRNTSQLVFGGGSDGDAVTLTSPDGNVLGYGLKTKNGVTPLKSGDMTEQQRDELILHHQTAQTALLAQASKAEAAGQTNLVASINDQIGTHRQAITELSKKGGASAPAATKSGTKPGDADVRYLAAHPEVKAAFNAKFGKGAADKYLP